MFSAFLLTLLFLLFLFSSLFFPVLYRYCCDVGSARHAWCGRQPAIQTVYLLQSVDLALSEAAFSGSILCAAVCHVSYCAKPLCIIESCCAPSRFSAAPCRRPPHHPPRCHTVEIDTSNISASSISSSENLKHCHIICLSGYFYVAI